MNSHERISSGRLRRTAGLIRKEGLQIVRDPSSFLIAGVLPLLLLFIFGFGVSLDLQAGAGWRGGGAADAGGEQLAGLVPKLASISRCDLLAIAGRSRTTWSPAG